MAKRLAILCNSTAVWLIILLVAVNVACSSYHPLKRVPHNLIPALQLSETALTFKFHRLVSQPAPSIMLLGSSLPMCAFYYSEGKLSEPIVELVRKEGLNLIQSYTEANYFKSEIKKISGEEKSVFNFTTAACMPSDARLLLMRIIESKHSPKTLIYGLGLRDFVDNVNPPPGETPAFKALCNATYLLSNVGVIAKPEARTELIISSLFQIYRVRDQLHLLAEHFLCNEFRRQTNMERAFSGIAQQRLAEEKQKRLQTPKQDSKGTLPGPITHASAKSGIGEPKAPLKSVATKNATKTPDASASSTIDLPELDYRQRYNPPNYSRLSAEMEELRKIIKLCKDSDIKLVLVNMPVTEGNKVLSAPGLRQSYLRQLRELAAQHSIQLVDFEESKSFERVDFLDTVHLSGYGAKKMIAVLVDSLCSSGILSEGH